MRKLLLIAAGSALLATTGAADAHHRRWRHHDHADAGDVIATAIVVGGIAALLSSSNEEKRLRQDAAVDICSAEAEQRIGGRVLDITDVYRRRGYYTVRGVLDRGPSFHCTVRHGTIYGFRTAGEA